MPQTSPGLSISDGTDVLSRTQSSLAGFTATLRKLEVFIATLPMPPKGTLWAGEVAFLLSQAAAEYARVTPLLSLLHANPSLFRRKPTDSLHHAWQLKRDWEESVARLADIANRCSALTMKIKPLSDMASEPPLAPAVTPAVEQWFTFLAGAVEHFGRSRAPLTLLTKDLDNPVGAPYAVSMMDAATLRVAATHITEARLFDEAYYLSQLKGKPLVGVAPLTHYLNEGWVRGLDPNPLFSVRYYLSRDAKLREQGGEPLSHYITVSATELRDPHPLFLADHYAAKRPKKHWVINTALGDFLSGVSEAPSPHPLLDAEYYAAQAMLATSLPAAALLHYLVKGWRRGLSLSPLFRPANYITQLDRTPEKEPYSHYAVHGARAGLNPHPLFNTAHYLRQQPEATTSDLDPLTHYLTEGEGKGASPSVLFDPVYYTKQYRPGQGVAGSLVHYLKEGFRKDFRPRADFDATRYRQVFMPKLPADVEPGALEHFALQGMTDLARIKELLAPPLPLPVGASLEVSVPIAATLTKRPKPTIAADLKEKLKFKEFPGKIAWISGQPNVLIVAHTASEMLFGGERSFMDMLDGLARVPANIFVLLPRNVPVYTNALRAKCQHVSVLSYSWWRKGEEPSQSVKDAIVQLIQSLHIDAVHVNTIMLRECVQAAKECDVPSVVHVRELIKQDKALIDLIGEPPEQIIEKVCNEADWIMANSAVTARNFYKPGRTFTVPNTVDLKAFAIPNTIEPSKPIRFGLVSSNLPKKGLADVVELARLAFKERLNAEFLLIGPETTAVREVQEQQAKGQAPSNIVFPGYAATPMDAIAQLNVVLNFSHFAESFGRTVLEAMAAGRPVVAYDWGALPELVLNDKTGFLVPYLQPQHALPIVAELCKSPERITTLGEAGKKLAHEHFGLEKYGAQFKQAYNSILTREFTLPDTSLGPIILPARLTDIKQVEKNPKIAYFCWHFPVPSETFVLNEIEVLVKSGMDVIVFCRQTPYKNFKPSFDVKYERVDSASMLARRLKETERTIVHAHFVYPTVTDMVWPACEEAGIPFTAMAHAQDIFKYDNDRKNRLAEIGASKWCRKLFTLSRFHFEFIASRGFPRDKLIINANAIDTTRFQAANVVAREKRSYRKIVAIHRYVEKKGLSQLIRSAALIRDLDVTIHIYGYGDLEAEYRTLVAELDLTNVVLHGQLTQDEVVNVMRKADLFACPSVRVANGDMDGIPTSLVESMAAGLPVLTTDISGIPELVTDSLTGIVAEPNPESIASAIRRYYAMPDTQVQAIITAAKERAALNHDAKRAVRVLRRVWENRSTDIIIVSWNNLEQLRAVVDRIIENTALPYHLIICDNQSSREPVAHYLDELWSKQERVCIVHNDSNAMVGPGTNTGLEQGVSDYAIYICGKEGVSFSNGWEIPFIHVLEDNPKAGLAGTMGRSPTYLTGEQYPRGVGLFNKFRNQDFAHKNKTRIFGHIQGGLFAIRRQMYEEIGGFSYDVPHDYTDVEYSYYAESCGWDLIEVPGVMALFNKSRPTLSQRFDETVVVAHPVSMDQVRRFDAVRAGKLKHCNCCDWFGEVFEQPGRRCGDCGSTPEDRTIYRWFAESPFMYRRLPALGVGMEGKMAAIWADQFQGPQFSRQELLAELRAAGRLKNAAGAFHLSIIRLSESETESDCMHLAKELQRVMKSGAVVLFQATSGEIDWSVTHSLVTAAMKSMKFKVLPDVQFFSGALQFSYAPVLAFVKD
jgi:glycosyltransferase involved in cell wall biosynthesis